MIGNWCLILETTWCFDTRNTQRVLLWVLNLAAMSEWPLLNNRGVCAVRFSASTHTKAVLRRMRDARVRLLAGKVHSPNKSDRSVTNPASTAP